MHEALLPRVLKIKSLVKGRDLDKAKKLAGIGSLLSIFGLNGIGYALVLAGVYYLGDYYKDEKIKRNALWWFIWWSIGTAIPIYITLIIGYAIFQKLMTLLLSDNYKPIESPLLLSSYKPIESPFLLDSSIILTATVVAIVALATLEVFYVLSAKHLKKTYVELANASGVDLFKTAAKFYWEGSLLVVVLVGFILIWISWIISAIAFFSTKPRRP